jgi:hypothetical protein
MCSRNHLFLLFFTHQPTHQHVIKTPPPSKGVFHKERRTVDGFCDELNQINKEDYNIKLEFCPFYSIWYMNIEILSTLAIVI